MIMMRTVKDTQETDDQEVMQVEYDKKLTLRLYQQKMKQAERELADVEYYRKLSEKREQDLIDKDRRLEQMRQELAKMMCQLAEKEKELYEIQNEKKRIEDAQVLHSKNDKDVLKKTKGRQEMENLVDQLFERDSDIIQAKLAIIRKFNAIIHGRRPSSAHF